ncbi:PEX26 [Mytilus edulis]|uniref:PEX26 n=1 Tax=Mytilus edulis TaxID=6550 RepID=A0A8S3SC29_MYTED|nr:PEX26 [Mytilus edulis]
MQQTLGEMEPAWKQYVKQVQKTCTGNLDVGEEFIVEYIEEGSLVFWTKTNSSTIKNKAKFAEIMDRFMVNLFQKCPIDTEDETKFSFSVDVVEGAEDEDTDDEDENDVFICGRCGITFKSFSSFTSHKRNINLCLKKTRTDQQHKNFEEPQSGLTSFSLNLGTDVLIISKGSREISNVIKKNVHDILLRVTKHSKFLQDISKERSPDIVEALCIVGIQAYAELNHWQQVLPYVQNVYTSIEECPFRVVQLCVLLHAKVEEYSQCYAIASIWLKDVKNPNDPDYLTLVDKKYP